MTTTEDNDTDPSTPGAKRVSDRRPAAPACLEDAKTPPSSPPRLKPTTDPGVAPPPSDHLSVPRQPLGVVVPTVARSVNDSVEMLLEGMDRGQPERPRSTSQSAGEAVASYHAEHAIRAPQRSPGDEPKVVIERRVLAQTLRDARSKAGQHRTQTQVLSPKPATTVGGRMLIAVVAGLAVVSLIFVALRRDPTKSIPATGASAAASVSVRAAASAVTEHADGVASGEGKMVPPTAVAASAERQASASTSSSIDAARKTPSVWRPAKQKLKPLPAETNPTGADVGEFRTSF